MRWLGLIVALAGCGYPDGARVEISVSNIQPGTGYIRATFADTPDDVVREVVWDGADPSVFQVLVPTDAPSLLTVEGIEYLPEGGVNVTGSYVDYIGLDSGGPPTFFEADLN